VNSSPQWPFVAGRAKNNGEPSVIGFLEPYQEQLEKYKHLSMDTEAKLLCMGMLQGIYDFGIESNTEFKDWAADAPGELFMIVLDDWKKWTKKRKDLAEMDEFMEKQCPNWFESRSQ
jgi:hypothetical protein